MAWSYSFALGIGVVPTVSIVAALLVINSRIPPVNPEDPHVWAEFWWEMTMLYRKFIIWTGGALILFVSICGVAYLLLGVEPFGSFPAEVWQQLWNSGAPILTGGLGLVSIGVMTLYVVRPLKRDIRVVLATVAPWINVFSAGIFWVTWKAGCVGVVDPLLWALWYSLLFAAVSIALPALCAARYVVPYRLGVHQGQALANRAS